MDWTSVMGTVDKDDMARIAEGAPVILRKLNGSRHFYIRAKRNINVTIENLRFRLDTSLFGRPYGIYNVKNGTLAEPTEDEIQSFKQLTATSTEFDELEEDGRGNQTNLVREKVQIKQAKRAQTLIQIERANTRLLAEFFYLRNPESVGFLRTDHISLIMQFSAIMSGSRVLIFDQCSGVVTSYVLERLGGAGHCVLLHNGERPNVPCVNNCQFPKHIASTLRTLPVRRILNPQKDAVLSEATKLEDVPMEKGDQVQTNGDKKTSDDAKSQQLQLETEACSWFSEEKLAGFGRFDCLLLICRNADPCSVLDHTFSAVRPSGNVVVYSPNASAISAAKMYLDQRVCLFSSTRSSQCREIQVLKHRTHPLMQHVIPGGYILSAIRGYNP